MKQQVKQMYEQIKMPASCVQAIRRAAENQAREETRPVPSRRRPAAVAAAFLAAVLVAGLAFNTEVRAAVDQFLKRYVFYQDTAVIEIDGDGTAMTSYDTGAPLFAQVRDGRIFFVANGEDLDITDQTSLEEPFLYTYVDDQNVEHSLIVGGTPENFGVHAFFREHGVHANSQDGWLGGYGSNYLDPDTGKAYPWLEKAWEELHIAWPLPGA